MFRSIAARSLIEVLLQAEVNLHTLLIKKKNLHTSFHMREKKLDIPAFFERKIIRGGMDY